MAQFWIKIVGCKVKMPNFSLKIRKMAGNVNWNCRCKIVVIYYNNPLLKWRPILLCSKTCRKLLVLQFFSYHKGKNGYRIEHLYLYSCNSGTEHMCNFYVWTFDITSVKVRIDKTPFWLTERSVGPIKKSI